MLSTSCFIGICLFLVAEAVPQTYTNLDEIPEDISDGLTRDRRLMVVKKMTWPKGILPYIIDPSAEHQKPNLHRVMSFVEDQSCIRFVYWNNETSSKLGLNNQGHIKFYIGSGCHSFTVGISRSPKGVRVSCCGAKTCLHEIGHALGFFHEQTNPKRNGWIRINMENVRPGSESLYTVTTNENANTSLPFDISSVMHYQTWAFSAGGPTFTNLNPEFTVGYLQFYFLMELAGGYRCHEKLQCGGKVLGCENDGYQTILHGKCACKCPPGLDPENMCRTPLRKVTTASWPKGQYSLPQPQTGCPSDGAFKDGRLSYSGTGDNSMSNPNHMMGEVRGRKIEIHFCSKMTKDEQYDFAEGPKFNWPTGNFCIYKKGNNCPEGFEAGSIHHRSTKNRPSTSGQVPEGVYSYNVEIKLCCSFRGFSDEPMSLPTDKPFTLFRHPNDGKCQAVQGMRFSEETFTITSTFKLKIDPLFSRWGRNYVRSLVIRLCHYKPVDMDCGGVITLSKSRPEVTIEMSGSGRTDLECTWLVKGNNQKGILVMTFEDFNVKKNGLYCEDKLVVRNARIAQRGVNYKAPECSPNLDTRRTIRTVYDKLHLSFFTYGNSQSSFKAKIKWIANEDMCYDAHNGGAGYDGSVNYTRTFQKCLPWAEMTECDHNPFLLEDIHDNLEGNTCRNPDNSFRPWCYTKKDGCSREYCDVCELEKPLDRIDYCDKLKNKGFCTIDADQAIKHCPNTCLDLLPNKSTIKKYTDISCGRPIPPTDGTVLGTPKSKYRVGETVQYKCKAMSSVVTSKCLTSGQWSDIGSSCLVCAPHQMFFNNKCYGLNKDELYLRFDAAVASCKREGGDLVAPKSKKESYLMVNVAKKHSNVWIGVTDRKTEGTFRYEDETNLVWKNWGKSEPNNYGRNGEDCAAMNRNTKWNDVSCSRRYPAICVLPIIEHSKCKDVLNDKCPSLLADRPSLCTDKLDFVRQYCRKSCGICKENSIRCPVQNANPNVLTLSVKGSTISVGEIANYECDRFSYHVSGQKSRACLPDGKLSGEPLECGDCPVGFTMLNNACHGLLIGDAEVTFSTARQRCKDLGGFLAMPKTKEENDLISSIGLGKTIRIGATDEFSEENVWEDGVNIDWSNWAAGEPSKNSSSYEHCAVMDAKKQWSKFVCHIKRQFPIVCTIPKSDDDLCYDMKDGGISYDGWVNYTLSDQPCIPWTQVTDCPHHSFNSGDEEFNLEQNYCRNPDNSYRPWCYTNKNGCKRNYCDVCGTGQQRDRLENCQALKSQGLCTKDKDRATKDCVATCRDQLNIKVPKIKKFTDIRCGPPRPPMDGVVVGQVHNQYKVGDAVEIKCKSEPWTVFSRCLTSGQWSEVGFACVQRECLVNVFDDNCYYWQQDTSKYNYDEAVAVCQKRNATVAAPRSQNEANFIRHLVPDVNNIVVGINDREKEGTWVYQDGSRVQWKNWKSGFNFEPNGKDGEQCAVMDSLTRWLDVPCTYKYAVVCAIPRKKPAVCTDFFATTCRKHLAQKPTMCKEHEGYARIFCAKTCGFCRN